MKTNNTYNIALLDGDLLIFTPPTYDMTDMPIYTGKSNPASSSGPLVQSILDKMYKKESELPYLFLQWAE